MAFFFFGTLMDRDVLERVLGRPVPEEQLAAARLPGYRRVRAAAASYPALLPCDGGVVEGIVLRVASPRDEARILHFEEAEYEAHVLPVHLADDGRRLEARVFMALDSMGFTEESWDLESWAREHKATYLIRCDEWLRDCPE
ncbi:MAG TPA: gamma-glutamylcyclotransferase family protein [Geminicoccaceae bacterium]|nr:gamma-glutamylcyclotransferase family protein [Geminicoccaceae bacterium]